MNLNYKDSTEALELAKLIMLQLAGRKPRVQRAVLAELLSLWLADHQGADAAAETELREILLADHIAVVRKLLPFNDRVVKERQGRRN